MHAGPFFSLASETPIRGGSSMFDAATNPTLIANRLAAQGVSGSRDARTRSMDSTKKSSRLFVAQKDRATAP